MLLWSNSLERRLITECKSVTAGPAMVPEIKSRHRVNKYRYGKFSFRETFVDGTVSLLKTGMGKSIETINNTMVTLLWEMVNVYFPFGS